MVGIGYGGCSGHIWESRMVSNRDAQWDSGVHGGYQGCMVDIRDVWWASGMYGGHQGFWASRIVGVSDKILWLPLCHRPK